MPAVPPTTTRLGLPRFASDQSVAGLPAAMNSITDSIDEEVGGQWKPYSPVWSQSGGSALDIGGGVLSGRYRRSGQTVYWSIYWERGTGTNVGSGNFYVFTLPPVAPLSWNRHSGSLAMTRNTAHYGGTVFPTSSTTVGVIISGGRVSHIIPTDQHAPGDWMILTGVYEAA